MATKKINDTILKSIANAIRGKLGVGTFYFPHEFASAINQIKGEPIIQPKSIYSNGLYSVSSGVDGFNPIVVSVPNTFSSADSGKVVSGASLVSQTPMSVDENGVYDTTFKNSITVSVPEASDITSDATLTSGSQMLSGYTAYARGSKYTGTIPMYNGSIDGGQGSIPSYDFYSGSYIITPSTVAQAFPTAGYIMSQNLQVLSYNAGSGGDPYDGSYVITPSIFSQAFPTAGKLLSQDIVVEPYSIDFYDGSYVFNPSVDQVILSTSGKTLMSDIQINAYSGSGEIRPTYDGSYVVTPSWLQQTFQTSGKIMTDDLVVESYPTYDTYGGSYVITPSTISQSFPTAGKLMEEDFVVEAYSGSSQEYNGDEITLRIGDFGSPSILTFKTSECVTTLASSAFRSMKALISATFPSCFRVLFDTFMLCENLIYISIPMCQEVQNDGFYKCSALESIDMPLVTDVYPEAFYECVSLANINLPSLARIHYSAFKSCAFSVTSFPRCTYIENHAFENCSNFSSLYLADERYFGVVSLQHSNAFDGTPFSNNDSAYAKIYVPSRLVSDYKADSVWSHFSNCIVAIDDEEEGE